VVLRLNTSASRKKRRIFFFPVKVWPGPTVKVAFGAHRLIIRSTF
jgi:hypothetical protein